MSTTEKVNPSLSVCFGIMNRLAFIHKGKRYPLLERTFPILLEACKHYGNINICMVDMSSDDGDLYGWSRNCCEQYGIPLYYVRSQRRPVYNIGYTKNLAAQLTNSEYISFIDVDMIIPVGFFEKGIEILRQKKCVWYPLYQREHSPDGKQYQGSGRGNCIMKREAWNIVKWPELNKYGSEDTLFCNRLMAQGYKQDRTQPEGFTHLWHPCSAEKREASIKEK